MNIKKTIVCILALISIIFSSCASMNPDEIDWEHTNYRVIGSGGVLPDKWASSYEGSQSEIAVGYVFCTTIILLPIGAPLALNGLYRVKRYESAAQKEEYKLAYQKQLIRRQLELEKYNKELEEYKKSLEEAK